MTLDSIKCRLDFFLFMFQTTVLFPAAIIGKVTK